MINPMPRITTALLVRDSNVRDVRGSCITKTFSKAKSKVTHNKGHPRSNRRSDP
jgi:hypothetical protein